ncbi:collagen alpha-1(III) chain-like [Solea solea]|uniref:collagen alpha-1(III) chain-like n=1 Tax=Solea solea TaxID=90069 RepID=UPI00272A7AB2|nr:collagen alpha-1(III) chain-like [Solea solea]
MAARGSSCWTFFSPIRFRILIQILCVSTGIHGACVYEGSAYANNSSWKPQSCQECHCYSDVVVCTHTHCPNPQCDYRLPVLALGNMAYGY